MIEQDDTKLSELIEANTAIVHPGLLPELKLRLVTQAQAWWRADPADLAKLGIVDPYWAFCWPGGAALARYVLDHPELCRKRRVLDLGTGCGVAAIAAVHSEATSVVACDIDQVALIAAATNAKLNDCQLALDHRNLIGQALTDIDCVLAADVTYSRELVDTLMPWFQQLLTAGIDIVIAEPQRGFLPKQLQASAVVRIPPEIVDVPLESGVDVPIYHLRAQSRSRIGQVPTPC